MNYETSINPDVTDDSTGRSTDDEVVIISRGGGRGRIIAIVLAVALAIGLVWYLTHRGPAAESTGDAAASQAQTVSVIAPGRVTVQGTINASGTIGAQRDLPVGIAGEGGRVVSVLVDAGDWVSAGQVLAVIDRSVQTQQAASQAANVQVQQANARLAQSNLDRAQQLVAKGFISKADIDRLTATRDAAVAQVRVAQATLGQLQATAARLNVVAPAAGLVLTRGVEPGQIVGAGSGTLFRIAKDGALEMQARLSESDLARLSVGVQAQIQPVGTDRAFTGQIWQLSPIIDPQTREGVARIALAYDAALRPGGFAAASIKVGTVTAPVLPESAILSDQKGAYVFVVGGNNKVERRAVTTGDVTPQGIIVKEGLSGSEHIVLRAGGFLNPGDLVRPVRSNQSAAASAQGR